MKKKIYIIAILCLLVLIFLSEENFAKYIMYENLEMQVYIDKTPPQISVISNGDTEIFSTTNLQKIQKRNNDIKIETSDNVKIQKNEYFYNSTSFNFDGQTPKKFVSGAVFSQEGYYKIISTDTSLNKTEIIILVDKSAPEVFVEFFKKGEVSEVFRQIAGCQKHMIAQNICDISFENEEKVDNESVLDTEAEVIEENVEKNEKQENVKDDVQDIIEQSQESKEENAVSEELIRNKEIDKVEELEFENSEEVIIPEQESILEDVAEEIVEIQIFEKKSIAEQENKAILKSGGDMYVGNEAEFRNALANQASVIHVRQCIDFTAPIYINYNVRIQAESDSNALRYGNSGHFIVVQNGGSFVLDSIVIDTNSSGANGIIAIAIEAGGDVTFFNSSIVDGGLGNTGILIYAGGNLTLDSAEIVRCGVGINLQMNGNLNFGYQEGRANNFYWNTVAVYIDNFYGNVNFNRNICMHDNSSYGIYVVNSCGTINVWEGIYYNNSHCIHVENVTGGSVNVFGGDFYANGWAMFVGGTLNLLGGSVHNNYYGILTANNYSGNFNMTGGNIYSNTSYQIYHTKTNDGGCTITGGSVIGEIYLADNDNYVNTNSSNVALTVTPSTYFFKRKLVKTTNNIIAQNQIFNVTVTPKDSWYKYVDNEFIVIWQGCNVRVLHKDYYGNILSSEIITGNLGENYTTFPKEISRYDLIYTPVNATGTFTEQEIIVEYKYDLVNVAKVSFEDMLTGVASAKYWYNPAEEQFSGNGIAFENGTIFEGYGYYKVVVENSVGLKKEKVFVLNKDSLKR